MARGDEVRLRTMLKLIELIRDRLEQVSRESFLDDPDQVDLTAFRLQHIGEGAHRLSAVLKARHPQVRWRAIVGMRNFLAHSYEEIRPALLWRTFIEDIDAVEVMCRAELGE